MFKHEHINQGYQKAWCTAGFGCVVPHPLQEYHHHQIAEDCKQEDDLWNELAKDVDVTSEVPINRNVY